MYMFMQHVYVCCRRFHRASSLLNNNQFQYGEYVLTNLVRTKLFKLQDGGVFNTARGRLPHSDIVGQHPGEKFADSAGQNMCIRRPSLAEYVCLMKRGPAPSYPKDIWAMIGHMNIGGGTCVLEAGSGSGSLTLHLSRTGMWLRLWVTYPDIMGSRGFPMVSDTGCECMIPHCLIINCLNLAEDNVVLLTQIASGVVCALCVWLAATLLQETHNCYYLTHLTQY